MRFAGLRFGTVDETDLRRLRSCAPSYDHVGSTLRTDGHPGRYEASVHLGSGDDVLGAAREALRSWVPQRSIGATIRPDGVRPDLGETLVIGLGVGRARLLVPNRIVAVVDEPDRYAFAYGTLPGHPERGEELFLVHRHDDGEVVLTIRVDAGPAPALARMGAVVRPLQRGALRRYLAAVAAHVRST